MHMNQPPSSSELGNALAYNIFIKRKKKRETERERRNTSGAFSHAVVSARGRFYSAFVPGHKSFTSLVTTRKSYAGGARTSGSRFISRNLGQRGKKITRARPSRARACNIGTSAACWEDKSAMRSHATAPGVIKLHRRFKR